MPVLATTGGFVIVLVSVFTTTPLLLLLPSPSFVIADDFPFPVLAVSLAAWVLVTVCPSWLLVPVVTATTTVLMLLPAEKDDASSVAALGVSTAGFPPVLILVGSLSGEAAVVEERRVSTVVCPAELVPVTVTVTTVTVPVAGSAGCVSVTGLHVELAICATNWVVVLLIWGWGSNCVDVALV